ncbi:MAG TPA: sigma-70 family RNA polymerase sigma factor [Bryobacteraceae bacterium]|nr:sigma-70 family RNA polymerase sigma factor [Bryobacteraceae bacterium]
MNEPDRLPATPVTAQPAATNWTRLVGRIQAKDPAAMEELYRLFSRGIRFYLCRQLGPQELEDKVHDTFLIVVQAIRRGDLREPDRLMGFVRTVVKRQVAAAIEQNVQTRRDMQGIEQGGSVSDQRETPEERVISRQRAEIMETVLRSLGPRDREILTRFYLLEQTQDQICAQMNLSDTQFRLLKSRAKARFGETGRRKLAKRLLHRFFLRKVAGSVH